jgi:hypothetical protein
MAKRKRQQGGSTRPASSRGASGSEQPNLQSRSEGRRAQRVIQQRQARRRKLITYVGGAVGVAIVAVGLLILFSRDTTDSASNEPVADAPALPTDVPLEGRSMGDPNAPVTFVEWGDFQ